MNVTKMMCDSRILENYGTNKVDKFTSDEVKKQDKWRKYKDFNKKKNYGK